MSEQFLTLGHKDRAEVLEVAALKTGRPAHLLEADFDFIMCEHVLILKMEM